jgi:hypothetical protein
MSDNEGHFTTDNLKASQQRVNMPLDGILFESQYYFFARPLTPIYDVVPSFRVWLCLHGQLGRCCVSL